MTCEDILEQAQRDQQRMEAAHLESVRQQVAMETFSAQIQVILALHNFQLSGLIYRGMFDPTFCAPTPKGKEV